MKVAFSFSMTPLARMSSLAMPRAPLSRVPMRMRLPLRSRRVVIGRSPRVKTQTGSWNSRPDRAQLGVLRVPALLLLAGQAPLQAADQAALDEARGDPGLVVGQRPQRDAALQRPQRAAAFPVLDPRGPPHLDLDAVLAAAPPVLGGQLEILGVARGDDDLALVVELLGVVENCEASDPEARGKHRHRARLGDILVHGVPFDLPDEAGPVPDAQK